MTHTNLRDGAISNNHRFTVTPIERRSTHTASSRSAMSYRIMKLLFHTVYDMSIIVK